MRAIPFGRDVVIDAADFHLTGRARRNLRQAVQRTHNAGITTEVIGEGWRNNAPASTARASIYALTIALAGIEVTYADVHTWRHMTANDLDYLAVLVAWGYTPCDLEQGLLDARAEQ